MRMREVVGSSRGVVAFSFSFDIFLLQFCYQLLSINPLSSASSSQPRPSLPSPTCCLQINEFYVVNPLG